MVRLGCCASVQVANLSLVPLMTATEQRSEKKKAAHVNSMAVTWQWLQLATFPLSVSALLAESTWAYTRASCHQVASGL